MFLSQVVPSAAGALGVVGFDDAIGFDDGSSGRVRHAVVVLIDGLGWRLLTEHHEIAPALAALVGGPQDTVFPSTTPTALASLGTGLLPGAHGMVGGTFWLPEADAVLNPLTWSTPVSPIAVQPEPTAFERIAAAGVSVSTVADGQYADSGLTRAVLRGGRYRATDLVHEAGSALSSCLAGVDRSLTYVYWSALDRAGHVSGPGSRAWQNELRRVDAVITQLLSALPPHSVMLVTADHGMVRCPLESRIHLERDAHLMAGVRLIAGEPRVRQVYCDDPAAVAGRWADRLKDRATVLTREELAQRGLVGPLDPDIADRYGDVIAIARDDWALASTTDVRVSGMLGQHGGLTAAERQIPALWARTG